MFSMSDWPDNLGTSAVMAAAAGGIARTVLKRSRRIRYLLQSFLFFRAPRSDLCRYGLSYINSGLSQVPREPASGTWVKEWPAWPNKSEKKDQAKA